MPGVLHVILMSDPKGQSFCHCLTNEQTKVQEGVVNGRARFQI